MTRIDRLQLRPARWQTDGEFENALERELAAFLQEEYAEQGEQFHPWYRTRFVPNNIGLAPYDWAIADFVSARREKFERFVEIGAGVGQQSILLASRGMPVWAVDGNKEYVELGARAIARIARSLSPGLPQLITQVLDFFPRRAPEYITPDTLVSFPTLNNTVTAAEFERVLENISKAKGVILALKHFMTMRETEGEQKALIEQIKQYGFRSPVDVSVWTTVERSFHPDRIVYFEKETASRDSGASMSSPFADDEEEMLSPLEAEKLGEISRPMQADIGGGRRPSAIARAEPVRFCYFGTCLVSQMLHPLLRFSGRPARWSLGGAGLHKTPTSYCLDDALQFANFLRGKVTVPEELRDVCDMEHGVAWAPSWDEALNETDLAVLEIGSPVAFMFGQYALCRAALRSHVLNPIVTTNELGAARRSWFYQGMLGGNEDLRAAAAERLVAGITDEHPNPRLARQILLETRPVERDLKGFVDGIAALRDLVDRPLGIITHTLRYMPDGRPSPFPPDLVELTIAAAKQLDLPVFEPSGFVRQYGVERAIGDNGTSFREEFRPDLAEFLLGFMQDKLLADGAVEHQAPTELAAGASPRPLVDAQSDQEPLVSADAAPPSLEVEVGAESRPLAGSPAAPAAAIKNGDGTPEPRPAVVQADLGAVAEPRKPPPTAEDILAIIDEMAGLPVPESGFYRVRPNTVSVRAYPFPYVAGLAVSNDPDAMSRAAFEDWHAFVNGRKPTSYGDGLGLEIGDAFWVWGTAASSDMSLHLQHPHDQPRKISPDFDRIVELGRLGWLDTIHSLTGFDSPKPPALERLKNPPHLRVTRSDVRYALDLMDNLGIKPSVYTNHGSAVTNIAGESLWYHGGDDPTHETYCLDLLKDFGFRFFWLDVGLDSDKFGDYLEYRGRPALATRVATTRFEWGRWLTVKRPDQDGGLYVTTLPLPEDKAERRARLVSYFNHTLYPARCQDGSGVWGFKRFRGTPRPAAPSFAVQVTRDRLDALEASKGTVVIYQHFGRFRLIGRNVQIPGDRPSVPPVFDEHGVACWHDIAERHRQGRLLVATTSRLLNYIWLREALKMSVEKTAEKWIVTLQGIECPVLGRHAFSPAYENGISFLVPASAPEVVVLREPGGPSLPLKRVPDPAFPNYHAVYQPWTALEWPDA